MDNQKNNNDTSTSSSQPSESSSSESSYSHETDGTSDSPDVKTKMSSEVRHRLQRRQDLIHFLNDDLDSSSGESDATFEGSDLSSSSTSTFSSTSETESTRDQLASEIADLEISKDDDNSNLSSNVDDPSRDSLGETTSEATSLTLSSEEEEAASVEDCYSSDD